LYLSKNHFEGKFSPEAIESFIQLNSIPLMDEIGPDNFMKYQQSQLPLAYLFVESDSERSKVGSMVESIAREFKNRMNFVYVDATKYGPHASSLNLKMEWPAFVIHDQVTNAKYPLDTSSSQPLTKDMVRNLVQAVLDGKAEPSLKSQPIPPNNEGPVKVIVGKEFNKIALDPHKDVLVEFYAPWCGHCKKLAPIYEKLGELFETNNNIVIAKIDATENDLPSNAGITIEGFPTIFLFQANPSNKPIAYEGDRSLDDLVNFIKENVINKVTDDMEHIKDEL